METVLITGGTGFLGKRLGISLKSDGYKVVLTGRNNKQNMMAAQFTGCDSLAMDVSHIESVRDIFTQFKPDIVIHAAATKFVDLAEKQPMEAIDINVVGSQNVARVAIEKEVKTVIGISTDKASPPVRNTYGLTKALMERMFCSLNDVGRTQFLCVRYGNVAWSTGSVLPIWRRMFTETGEIGTTGPEMYRFFFTVDEAVELVKTGLSLSHDLAGKVLSRKMKAAQIGEVLNVWINHFGGNVKQLPTRPGERLEEYLFGDIELPYTEERMIGDLMHFVISFNKKAKFPVTTVLSSRNTDQLSEEEIFGILNMVPMEEL